MILLDLDALAAAEGEDWIWQGAETLPPEHARAILRLSRGGSDAVVLREFDLVARQFVADGFVLPEAKGGVSWLDQDTVLLSTALGGTTSSGYARTVRLWRRGTAWSEGPLLFQTEPDEHERLGWLRPPCQPDDLWRENRVLRRQGLARRPQRADATDRPADRRLVQPGTQPGSRSAAAPPGPPAPMTFQPDEVVVIRLDDFLAGVRRFTKVFEPGPRRALQGFFWVDGRLLLSVLDDLRPVFLSLNAGATGSQHRSPGCRRSGP